MAASINCSFKDLGDACRYAWQMCDHDQEDFFNYKNKYTKVFCGENLAEVQAFLQMDSYDMLLKITVEARQAFYKQRDELIDLFHYLKGYNNEIETDTEKRKTLNKDAGQQVFSTMNKTVWKDIDSLANTMLAFIPKYQKALSEGGMPAEFVARIENKRAAILAAYQFLGVKEAEAKVATDARTLAGIGLQDKVKAMLKDAQLVYRDNKERAKKYVWETILAQVRGVKDAGLNGKVTIEGAKTGIPNATIAIPTLNLSVVSDADGKYAFLVLPAGTYDLEVTCAGYETLIIKEREIKMNVVGRLNIALVAVAV